MSSNSSLALLAPLLTAQLDGLAVVLKDATARLETIKTATAQAAERETPSTPRPAETPVHDPDRDDPDRIISLAEAARLSSLSVYTLRRRFRSKFIRLGARRVGLRRRDVLHLSG